MALPAAGAISAAANQGVGKGLLEDVFVAIKQIPGAGQVEQALTIATGTITPAAGASGIISVDTEAAAATDDLANIALTNIPDGSQIEIRCVSASRVIVVKHSAGGSGQLSLSTGGDCTLGDPSHWLRLKRTGTLLEEMSRYPPPMRGVVTRTSNTMIKAADIGKLIDATSGTWSQTFEACATLGKGWWAAIRNSGTAVITLDPNGSELINAVPTLALNPGDECLLICDGTGLKTFGGQIAQSVAFSVHKNGTSQTAVATATFTKVTFGTEEFDTKNNFASSTFTPTVAGKYLLVAAANFNAAVDQTDCVVSIYKNGARYKEAHGTYSGIAAQGPVMTAIVDANGSTDYFEVYAYQTTGVNQDIQGSPLTTYFMGAKLP